MRKIIVALLIIAMLSCLFTGCQKEHDYQAGDSGPANRTVTVLTASGKPVPDVLVKIYSDSSLTNLAFGGKTDENGSFAYTAKATDPYYAVFSKLPNGLTCDASYLLSQDTKITLKMSAPATEDFFQTSLKLGDSVPDFTVTDCDGNSYTLSQLLEQKKAVVLNFWFMGCAPCKNEFPHLQAAYEQYSDEIAVLALNPMDSDDAAIAKFRQENGYDFAMGKADARWSQVFRINAYPLTVVIDCYGEVAYLHSGAMKTQDFVDIFETYTADDYG